MRKFTHGATRLGTAAVAAAVLMTAACDDATAPWPSRGPATEMAIYTIPAGQPYLLLRGQSLRLLGVATDASGTWVDQPVTWSSSNDAIATISSDGVLTAVGNVNVTEVDTITVTAQSAGRTAERRVIIRRFPAVASIVMSGSVYIAPGQTVQLTATPRDAANVAIEGRSVTWTSSNTGIATVTQTGAVTRVGTGMVTITASAVEEGQTIQATWVMNAQAPQLTAGAFVPPTIADGTFAEYMIVVPAGTNLLRIAISGGTGDTDMYLYAPGSRPGAATSTDAGSGWHCRPWAIGSTETCTVSNPTAGTWGLRLLAYGGDGAVTGLNVVVTVD
jgi:hypothetical protein